MSYTYDRRRRPQEPQNTPPERTSAPGPTMDALLSGAAAPTAAQKGRSIDLDAAMKAKMEHAFGDLSAVKLYESRAVGDAGAEAIARGNEIAFAPGMANFSTRSGQERLGHELSHVMSQRSGAVRGEGFLANSALEARADREGAMAAAGQQVYTGPVTHALSDAAPSPAVAGPMQAKRRDDEAQEVKEMTKSGKKRNYNYATSDSPGYNQLGDEWEERVHTPGFTKHFGKKEQRFKVRKNVTARGGNAHKAFENTPVLDPLNPSSMTRNFDLNVIGKLGMGDRYYPKMETMSQVPNREGRDALFERIKTKHENTDVYEGGMGVPQNSDGSVKLRQSGTSRMIKDL